MAVECGRHAFFLDVLSGVTWDTDTQYTYTVTPRDLSANQNATAASAGAGATSHDVYFGTSAAPGAGEFQGNQTGTTFATGALSARTWCYMLLDFFGHHIVRLVLTGCEGVKVLHFLYLLHTWFYAARSGWCNGPLFAMFFDNIAHFLSVVLTVC